MSLLRAAAIALLFLLAGGAAAQDTALIDAFIKPASYEQVKLSPDGTHLALVVPQGERSILATFRRADLQPVGSFAIAGKTRVRNFWWVDDTRIVLTFAERDGLLARPLNTGELYAVDVDGRNNRMLTGPRGTTDEEGKTFAMRRSSAPVWAEFVDVLANYPGQVLIASTLLNDAEPSSTSVERMDAGSGRTFPQTRVPVPFADVVADRAGDARFAWGVPPHGEHRLYYRAGPGAEWQLLNDEATSHHREWMLGFNADESVAYLWVEKPQGPSVVEALTLATMARKPALADPRVDPAVVLRAPDRRTVLGIGFRNPKLTYRFFDDADPQARVLRALLAAFPGQNVAIAGYSGDGSQALVEVADDRDSGATYLFDIAARKAELLVTRQEWLLPDGMAPVVPLDLVARDGTPLPSLLTLPRNVARPPLIVVPHGGPFGAFDAWGFDGEAQLLAAHGYAVLQVNFRGSGNYGRAFELAGYRQWGGAMQDDITDATRAVIAQGKVDGSRACIYGASYGAYAALMAPVRAPGLFRCAAGYVGVYDLPQILRDDNDTRRDRIDLARTLGTDVAALRAQSPVTLAAAIKVPVFLAVGEQDKVAPKVHSERMRDALAAAGNAPQWLNYADEGHGYYRPEHRRDFYRQLIAFFATHLGTDAAPAAQ